MVPLNALKRQYEALAAELDEAVNRVMTSGWYVLGPEHDAFEYEFAEAQGADHCVAVGNGTDALEIALVALGCGPGSAVVTVSNAGGYTSSAARKIGAEPVYVDVDPDRLLVRPDEVAAVLEGADAVVVTHLYGQLAPVEQVVELAKTRGIPVVEDCAQAVGARRAGRTAGTFGDIGTFSFYPTKNLGAAGDGGALLIRDEDIASRARSLRQYGWAGKYEVCLAGGRNSRLDELQAAVLRVKLRHVSSWNDRRRTVVGRYRASLRSGASLTMVSRSSADDVAHLCVGLTADRARTVEQLQQRGVATGVHYPVPDHEQPAWRDQAGGRALPVTERTQAQILTLPCFPELTDDEVEQVCGALASL